MAVSTVWWVMWLLDLRIPTFVFATVGTIISSKCKPLAHSSKQDLNPPSRHFPLRLPAMWHRLVPSMTHKKPVTKLVLDPMNPIASSTTTLSIIQNASANSPSRTTVTNHEFVQPHRAQTVNSHCSYPRACTLGSDLGYAAYSEALMPVTDEILDSTTCDNGKAVEATYILKNIRIAPVFVNAFPNHLFLSKAEKEFSGQKRKRKKIIGRWWIIRMSKWKTMIWHWLCWILHDT